MNFKRILDEEGFLSYKCKNYTIYKVRGGYCVCDGTGFQSENFKTVKAAKEFANQYELNKQEEKKKIDYLMIKYDYWESLNYDEKMKYRKDYLLWNNGNTCVYFFRTFKDYNLFLFSAEHIDSGFLGIKYTKTDEYLTQEEFLNSLRQELNNQLNERGAGRKSNIDLEKLKELYFLGYKKEKIAVELNCSLSTVKKHLKDNYYFCPKKCVSYQGCSYIDNGVCKVKDMHYLCPFWDEKFVIL